MTPQERVSFVQIYMIPKYEFEIPSEPLSYITQNVRNLIESKYLDKLKGWDLYFNILFPYDLDENLKKTEVKGPSRNNREKIVSYSIMLPSTSIRQSEEPFLDFLKYFFEALTSFLHEKYTVDKQEVLAIQQQVYKSFNAYGRLIHPLPEPLYAAPIIIPEQTKELQDEEEDDPYSPVNINITEEEEVVDNVPVTHYTYTLDMEADFDEEFAEIVQDFGLEMNGYTVEAIVETYLKQTDENLLDHIESYDSESATFVAYTNSEASLHKIAALIQKLCTNQKIFKNLIESKLPEIKERYLN